MIYIITALKAEAQAFVDRYRPSKEICDGYTFYDGGFFRLIVGGIGVHNTIVAVEALVKRHSPADGDVFLNVGICAADKSHTVGELIRIGRIAYKGVVFTLDKNAEATLTCKDSEDAFGTDEIVDMESYGFYEATKEFKNRYMYKVVSDHFEPAKVTKEGAKKLLFGVIDDIFKEVGI